MTIDTLPPVARKTDPITSKIAERLIAGKRPTQMSRLLNIYYNMDALTDELAAEFAGISHQSATKRCADLRNAGLIEPTGELAYGQAGMPQRLCRITKAGIAVIEQAVCK